MREIEMLVRIFKALGDETRLKLVRLLGARQRDQAFCVTRLAKELEVTPSSVSQHLRILKDLGLVNSERRGYQIHYWLDTDGLAAYRDLARQELGDALSDLLVSNIIEEEQNEMSPCGCDQGKCNCEHPELQQGEGTECTPEQIRACHGEDQEHPCTAVQAQEQAQDQA